MLLLNKHGQNWGNPNILIFSFFQALCSIKNITQGVFVYFPVEKLFITCAFIMSLQTWSNGPWFIGALYYLKCRITRYSPLSASMARLEWLRWGGDQQPAWRGSARRPDEQPTYSARPQLTQQRQRSAPLRATGEWRRELQWLGARKKITTTLSFASSVLKKRLRVLFYTGIIPWFCK